jgi:DNA adenine methylase
LIKPNHSNTTKPFLRWAGSKQQLVPVLSRYWNSSYTRYVEPFAGSASWFFSLSPSSALLGDINKELVLTYRQIQGHVEDVIYALAKLEVNRTNYLYLRGIQIKTLSNPERAARFIFLNRFSFNAIYRTNSSGQFNVPYNGGAGKIPNAILLRQCSKALQVARLITGSFEKTLEEVKAGDFVYMDPPYSIKARRTFNEYDASVFSQDQLKVLRDWMLLLDRKEIRFLVSYAASEEGSYLSDGFYCQTVSVRRNVAGFAANRRHADELLISNVVSRVQGA